MEMTLQELAETQKKKQKVTRPSPSPSTPMPSSMPSTPTPAVASDGVGGTDISLQEYLRNPAYDPPAQAVQPKSRSMGELFEQPLFKRQKQALGEADDSALFATSFFNSQHELVVRNWRARSIWICQPSRQSGDACEDLPKLST